MEEGKKLKISYRNLEEFEFTPVVNGIFGGISPDGLLTLNLYFDRKSMPTSLEIEHIEHHLFGNERPLDFEEGSDVIREVVAKVALTPRAALNIGRWIVKKAEEAQKIIDGGKKKE
ncbi:MAG TPA: hypothetical protein PLF44_00015 [Candidatus Mcinerneyibacteriales bacterium]|nr:hypothetical protein [Candidatus Mcinerneyibacteriota bacterium]HOO59622.1 hypothetical protein [Candidatus Mcinerneyibacteriales bacterium]HPE19801.1 hypothetical protein [Candidatus Mcinerneyibacteriales bacterium]HPJ69239.1 hypothetical protein [Candidatus Mcinerneyibacteriales bacterium]HPQ89522.1 hypothetical protein [Candidatus Mcinerneyibacteriales bacterium]